MKKQVSTIAAGVVLASGVAHADPVRLSHSLEEFLVTTGTILCATTGAPQTTAENSFYRSFTLGDFGITEAVTVQNVEVGIENLFLPTSIETDITVNLYQAPAGSAPALGQELIGTAVFTSGDRALEVVTIDVDGVVAAGNALVVEVFAPDFTIDGLTGDVFFPGSNNFGQTAPSYLRAPTCGAADPTTYDSIGFPEVNLIIIANGETGGVVCRADLDGDGSLTIFDFLTFQNLFDAGDPTADFDGDGSLTIFDFLTFQNEFDAGC
jgi:hypothetical protein